jgi:hypothetical protein
MFKKLGFKSLNYKELDRYDPFDLKRDEIQSFYQTFDFFDLIKKWPQIVGPKLAPFTSPLKLQQGSLFIITRHSVYSQELSFLSEEIKTEIFRILPKLRPVIKKLVFQTQEKFFEQRQEQEDIQLKTQTPRLHPQSPQYKKLKLEAESLFANIEDPEVKAMMISIYIQSR